MISRRKMMIGAIATAASALEDARTGGILIDSHMHLFAGDPGRFPYNTGSYAPKPLPVEEYVKFVPKAHIDHTVIVHPEPYQDDHRYLEYCFAHEPSPHFFKGTCLFDPIDPKTPKRIEVLMLRNQGRIVALRIHEIHPAGTPSTTTGVIRDRDLKDPQMAVTWRAAHDLGLAIQLHCIPHYAPQIGELAAKFPDMPIVLDHLARPGQGTSEEYEQVLKLATLPRAYMKYSSTGVESASREPFPHRDAKPLVKRVYEAFGADKIIWGGLGGNMSAFQQETELFDLMFDFVQEPERKKIRGLTAQKLFAFS